MVFFVGGTEAGDQLSAEEGVNSSLNGLGGNDQLTGSTGNDTLNGGLGHDTMIGADGADLLTDQQGSNWFEGGRGNDTINFSGGINIALSGDDHDVVTIGSGLYAYTDLGPGNDTVSATSGFGSIIGGTGEHDLLAINLAPADINVTQNSGFWTVASKAGDWAYSVLGVEKLMLQGQQQDLTASPQPYVFTTAAPAVRVIQTVQDLREALADLEISIDYTDTRDPSQGSLVNVNGQTRVQLFNPGAAPASALTQRTFGFMGDYFNGSLGSIDVGANGQSTLTRSPLASWGGEPESILGLLRQQQPTAAGPHSVVLTIEPTRAEIGWPNQGPNAFAQQDLNTPATPGFPDVVLELTSNFWTDFQAYPGWSAAPQPVSLGTATWDALPSGSPLVVDLGILASQGPDRLVQKLDQQFALSVDLEGYTNFATNADNGPAGFGRAEFVHQGSGEIISLKIGDHERIGSGWSLAGAYEPLFTSTSDPNRWSGTRVEYELGTDWGSIQNLLRATQRAYDFDLAQHLQTGLGLESFDGQSNWTLSNLFAGGGLMGSMLTDQSFNWTAQGITPALLSFNTKPIYEVGQSRTDVIDPDSPALIVSSSPSQGLYYSPGSNYKETGLDINLDLGGSSTVFELAYANLNANLSYKLVGFESQDGARRPVTAELANAIRDFNQQLPAAGPAVVRYDNFSTPDGFVFDETILRDMYYSRLQPLVSAAGAGITATDRAVFVLSNLNLNLNSPLFSALTPSTVSVWNPAIQGATDPYTLWNIFDNRDNYFPGTVSGAFQDYSIGELLPTLSSLSVLRLDGIGAPLTGPFAQPSAFSITSVGAGFSEFLQAGPEDSAIRFAYSLRDLASDQVAPLTQSAVLGDSVDPFKRYILDIKAESLQDGYDIESADITLEFDPKLFGDIGVWDIQIGEALPLANAVQIDNQAGTIRIAGSSLSSLNQGSGISSEAVLASIRLDFDEYQLELIEKNSDGSLKTNPLSFAISVNANETILSRTFDDGTGLLNREVVSLTDLGGGVDVQGQDVTLYEAKINLEQMGDGLVLGTQRVIGADAGFTNLIRSGDTLITNAQWLNVGNIKADNLQVAGSWNPTAVLRDAALSATSINSGSFINGVFDPGARETVALTAEIQVTGSAGQVVDLSTGILSLQANGSDPFSNAGKGSANLITFQGDLNYDGRVSMKDLAYLNAGAARQQTTAENPAGLDADTNGFIDASVARDVDADFNGKIDLADLAILDADWGKTLHIGDQQFQGSADLSWSDLDSQGSNATWDNSSFKTQNAIEADPAYVGSLESPAPSGVIGADGDSYANNNDMQGGFFQDPITAV
jgi:hypothetical protein